MIWLGHLARVGDRRGVYEHWWGDLKEKYNLGDLGVVGWIIFKLLFKK